MKRLLLIACLFAPHAYAADDPKAQVEFLQTALQEVQAQRNAAFDQIAAVKAQAAAQINTLQKRVAELEEAAKLKEKK